MQYAKTPTVFTLALALLTAMLLAMLGCVSAPPEQRGGDGSRKERSGPIDFTQGIIKGLILVLAAGLDMLGQGRS